MEEQPIRAVLGAPPPPKPKRIYEIDLRDRVLLVLALGLGVLLANVLLSISYGYPGLGVALLVLAWEGVLLWYASKGGVLAPLKSRAGLLLTLAVLLLAADFALLSNRWFWSVNVFALPALMGVQLFQLFGNARCPWHRPMMLAERAALVMEGLFCRLGAPAQALGRGGGNRRRLLYVLGGLALAGPIFLAAGLLLMSADPLFATVAGDLAQFLVRQFGSLMGRLLLGLLAAPFLFGLLYTLRRPEENRLGLEKLTAERFSRADPAMAVTVLAALDGLYLLFVAVQARGLFGGPAYLETMGISVAGYARGGFFQLVWVSVINLLVVLGAVQITRREGRLWRALQVLSSLMVALSALLLVSAAWRMTLYVTEYGLSFKRFLTYWGMAMLAIFFAAALWKIWRPDFAFFRVLFAAGVAGWLVLNACNVDTVVARYNVALYLGGNTAVMDVAYLATELSYDALPALEALPGDMRVYYGAGDERGWSYTLDDLIQQRREEARTEATAWETWTLSAYLAAGG